MTIRGAVDSVRQIGAAKNSQFRVGLPESEIGQGETSTAPPIRALLLVQVQLLGK